MVRMLSIPATKRLTDSCGVRPHAPVGRKYPVLDPRPAGYPVVSEEERIRLLREQRRRNLWRKLCLTQEIDSPAADLYPDNPAP